MKFLLLLKTLFLLILAFKANGQSIKPYTPPKQTRNGYGWYVIYRSNNGIDGNSLYFGDSENTTERITSGPLGATHGPEKGLNFITDRKIRMSIANRGDVAIAETLTVGKDLITKNNITTGGVLEATKAPVKINRLHIDPDNNSDGYNYAGIFFGGRSYSEATTGIGSNINGSLGPKNGLNFWTKGNLAMTIDSIGRIGIGIDPNQIPHKDSEHKLFIKGSIKASNLQITNLGKWPDYVFDKNYNLKSLDSLEKFVIDNKHLPNFPSAKQIENDNNAISVSGIITALLKTVEEQALYIMDINKKVESMQQKLDALINNEQ